MTVSIDPGTVLVDPKTGRLTTDGYRIVAALVNNELPRYTVASLPRATTPGRLIYVSDGASNKRLAISDGTNWRFPDGNVVS